MQEKLLINADNASEIRENHIQGLINGMLHWNYVSYI